MKAPVHKREPARPSLFASVYLGPPPCRERACRYCDFRRDVIRVVNNGAAPFEISGLLAKCSDAHRQIEREEIDGLALRCDGCWRLKYECEARPCGLDKRGRTAPKSVDMDAAKVG